MADEHQGHIHATLASHEHSTYVITENSAADQTPIAAPLQAQPRPPSSTAELSTSLPRIDSPSILNGGSLVAIPHSGAHFRTESAASHSSNSATLPKHNRLPSISKLPESKVVKVFLASEDDLPWLASVDVELTENILAKKIQAGEVLIARIYTLVALNAAEKEKEKAKMVAAEVNGQSNSASSTSRTSPIPSQTPPPYPTRTSSLFQPTPHLYTSNVNIDLLSQTAPESDSASQGSSASVSSSGSPAPLNQQPPSKNSQSLTLPTNQTPAPNPATTPSPPPTHGVISVVNAGFLRFGHLFDSVPFLYRLFALDTGGYSSGNLGTRLIDAWELEMKVRGHGVVLASVETPLLPAELSTISSAGAPVDRVADVQPTIETELLLKRMGYLPRGEIRFPDGAVERISGKMLTDVRNAGELMS